MFQLAEQLLLAGRTETPFRDGAVERPEQRIRFVPGAGRRGQRQQRDKQKQVSSHVCVADAQPVPYGAFPDKYTEKR